MAEHWNTALWFSMTVWFIGEITTVGGEMDSPVSSFNPVFPLRPGTLWIRNPCFPFRPGGPALPCFPCFPGSPLSPRGPFLPVAPRDPLGSYIPSGPCTHICSSGEQNDHDIREFKVLFISLLTDSIINSSGFVPVLDENRRVLPVWTVSDAC